MGIVANIKRNIGLSKLSKLSIGVIRNKRVHNFESARKVAVLSYAASKQDLDHAMEFVSFLTNKNLGVCLLAYVPAKETPNGYSNSSNANFFSQKEINWYHKPLPEFVGDFLGMEFDILIDLSRQEVFPLRWIASLSKAQFKVGGLSYHGAPYDMTINLSTNEDFHYYISQIKYYLNLINNRFAQQEYA